MPNWCSTKYEIYNGGVKELTKIVKDLQASKKENWNWLGNIVSALGGNPEALYCRGWIEDFDATDDCLTLYCETAWSELSEWRKFVKDKFENCEIFYVAEEPGMGIFITNDVDFDYIYQLETDMETMEFGKNELEECLAEICKWVGKPVSNDRKQVLEWAEEYNNANIDNDKFIFFHEYTYVSD